MVPYECLVCGYIYDPKAGDPKAGIPPGVNSMHCQMTGSARSVGQEKISL